MLRLVGIIAAVGACGRIGYEDVSDADEDGAVPDAPGLSLDATVLGDGVVAAACGASVLLQDGFDTPGPAPTFTTYASGGLTLQETQSRFEVVFPATVNSNNYAGYKSNAVFTTEGLCSSVQVVAVPSGGMAFFKLWSATQQVETIAIAGLLQFRTHLSDAVAVIAELPYDPVAHRFWRIRQQGGVTFWDTSSNGVDYVAHASTTFVTVAALYCEMGGGAFTTVTNGGTAAYDDALVTGP